MTTTPPVFARAIVKENEDPEKRGRVKVEYPWFSKREADLPSDWARVTSPFASPNAGWISTPDIGDEVIVLFEDGNLDSPIVIGSLYSKKNEPPRTDEDKATEDASLRFLRTKAGHLLVFNDEPGQEKILLQDAQGRSLELSNSEQKVQLQDNQQQHLKMDSKGVQIQTKDQHRVDLHGDKIQIQHSSGSHIQITASGVTIQGTAKIELGEGAMEALVKGRTFLQLFNTHTHPHPLGPTGVPTAPLQPSMVLSQKVKTV